ncbi:hypothetical protein L3067_04225 [Xanthomonas sp. PPL568]|uniref:hypothetical protein n=1 Tax=Xanthomonas indica TaxID=2912242 RepID=UPI001F5A4497|nr:hypothetical protein [Xanthomonas indica]MCI2243814.1 hypothetical protein [Xanthomonas indica]
MILQRIADWRRERRIRRLAAALRLANTAGQHALARAYWEGMRSECLARSAAQVARMERAGGLA